jgi:hypothetical protein
MVAFDTSFLILAFDEKAASRQAIPHLAERIDLLLADLKKSRTKVIIPTPALSEFLVRADIALLEILNTSSLVKIAPFDQRAAIEAATMTRDAIREIGKKDQVAAATWAKIKFDRQIVAIAKVEGVDAIYSTDPDIVRHSQRAGIRCLGIPDLPTSPDFEPPPLIKLIQESKANDTAKQEVGEIEQLASEKPAGETESGS